MKKQFAFAAISFAALGSLSAQSLFDLAPDLSEEDSFPLRWTAGVSVGYDDNPTPLTPNGDESSLYANAYIGASLLTNTPQTTTEFFARVGVIHYFDDIEIPGFDIDQTTPQAGVGLNITHRVSERLRFVSRNDLRYEREPDYSFGNQGAVQIGSYLRWTTDNAIGYRWTDRLATYTGFTLNGVDYQSDIIRSDVFSWSVYNNFRYQISEQTVGTFNVRYTQTEIDGSSRDSENIFLSLGVEQRLSPTSVFTAKAGVQLRDIDGGDDNSSFFGEAALRTKINESMSVRGYARYAVEDYSRFVGGSQFDGVQTLRVGIRGDYRVSEQLTLNAGVNYVDLGYEDQVGGGSDLDEDLLNAFLGFSFRVADGVNLTGAYNFEDFGSSAVGRDYDRSRISLGVNTQF